MPPLLTARAAVQLLMAGADGALFSHTAPWKWRPLGMAAFGGGWS